MSSVVLRDLASTRGVQDVIGLGPMAPVDADMRHVLDILHSMEPKPIEHCSPAEARAQPTLVTALGQLLRGRTEESGVGMEMRLIPSESGDIRARVYAPLGIESGETLPMILYLHGGGFVMGDIDGYDATPRALSERCRAIVVSSHYRQAPEHKFPAAHEDAWTAWAWMIAHAEALGGDSNRAAIVGEDAGANLALNVALMARDAAGVRPRHLALISPMAGTDFELDSYEESAAAPPLSADGVRWLYKKLTRKREALGDPRLDLIERGDFGGLPPATIILAALDPLRSEGELLAHALRRSGAWVDATTYDGVTHGFFGLARVVNKAMFAQGQVIRNLRESFS